MVTGNEEGDAVVDFEKLGPWVLAGVIVLVAIAAYVAYRRISKAAREISKAAFGTENLSEGIERMNYEREVTPKSLSAATSLFLPQIHEDFPEFNFNDMRVRAENVLTSYLLAIDSQDPTKLVEGSEELRENLRMRIYMLKDAWQVEQFDKVKVHRTAIANYERKNGRCTVRFQTSVQYKHALYDADNTVLKGDPDKLEQARYNIDLVYVQDRDVVEDDRDRGEGLNCPNCGAPITNVGAKKCSYCGTSIIPYNLRVWSFHKVEEG